MAQGVTREWLERVFEDTKNWGRWGPDDERGALNYITDKKRAAAARLVRDGHALSLARDFPTEPSPENPHPAQHMMTLAGDVCGASQVPGLEMAMDWVGIAFHGLALRPDMIGKHGQQGDSQGGNSGQAEESLPNIGKARREHGRFLLFRWDASSWRVSRHWPSGQRRSCTNHPIHRRNPS